MSKKSREAAVSYSRGLAPTNERRQHQGGVTVESINEKNDCITYTRRYRSQFNTVVEGYAWQGLIAPEELAAGSRFEKEFLRSVLKIKIHDGDGCHGDVEMPAISSINGNRILREAFDLLSPVQREILISVCVENKSAGTTRRLKYLRRALQILARQWKLL